ncbi:MAG: hypothetical protein QXY94_06305 [Archaeoglobaceae archaeon]
MGLVGLRFCFFFLGACYSPPPANTPERVNNPAYLSPLSQSAQSALYEQAFSSPAVQAVLQKLHQRGWQEVQNQEISFAFEKAQILLVPFAKRSSQDQGDQTPPPSQRIQLSSASRPLPQPKSPSEPPNLAYLVYAATPEGAEAFAVLRESGEEFLHLYPEADCRLRLLAGGENVLTQLRQNERFTKFETYLKTRVEKVTCGPVILDEANNVAYIFVQGLSSPLSTKAFAPAVYPPPSSYIPQEGCVYIVLAKVTSVAAGFLTVDPQSLWVSPYLMKSGTFASESLETTSHSILAGGKKPRGWEDLRSFAYIVVASSPLSQPEPAVSPQQSALAEPPTVQTLVAFIWGLADYPEENMLGRFKTDLEITLEYYNKAMEKAKFGAVGIAKQNIRYILAGYQTLTPKQAQEVMQKMESIEGSVISFDVLRWLIEEAIGLSLEELGDLLLRLAAAEKAGKFDIEYDALVKTKLQKFLTLMLEIPKYIPANISGWYFRLSPEEKEQRAKVFIRDLAREYQRLVQSQSLEPSELEVKAVPVVIAAAGKLVLETLAQFAVEKLLGLAFKKEDLPLDKISLEILKEVDEIKYFVIAALEAKSFENDLATYINRGGNLFGWHYSIYNSAFSNLARFPEYLGILSIVHHRVTKNLLDTDVFKEKMGLLLQTVLFLQGIYEKEELNLWKPRGAILAPGMDSLTIVLGRIWTFPDFKATEVAAIYLSLIRTPHPCSDHYLSWFQQADELLPKVEETLEKEKREKVGDKLEILKGQRIAAVVFRDEVDPKSVRALVDTLHQQMGYYLNPSKRCYVIWREQDAIMYSVVAGERSPDLDMENVRSLVPDWVISLKLPIKEYIPSSSSGSQDSSQTSSPVETPVVIVGGGWEKFEGATIHMMTWARP